MAALLQVRCRCPARSSPKRGTTAGANKNRCHNRTGNLEPAHAPVRPGLDLLRGPCRRLEDSQPDQHPLPLATILPCFHTQELGEENLEERLTSATRSPAQPAHRLAQLIADVVPTGRPVLVLELARGPHVASSAALGELAAAALAAGADALAVKTDSEDTPEPLKDVLAATQAAAAAFERQRPPPRANPFAGPQPGPAPVLQRDW